jgi:predicted  nucleic acid-binding Zn-ribbon protein
MAVTATFYADFSKWDSALKNAQANLKTFEVSTKNVQQSLQRMTSGFDGTKIMREAKTVVAAIEAIGGASKLTAAEQRKVNATVTEAIAKYKALGQVAPKEMQALANATKQVVAPTQAATTSVASLVASYVTIGAAIALATKAIGGLVDFLSSSITSYAQAEAAQNRMVAALRAQGTATPTVIKQYAELASTIQRTTAFSDDAANEMQALFISIGNVGPAQMEKATTAATDLAAGLGIDLTQAATLVSKALAGNTGALGRYGIKLDAAKVAAEGASAVFGAINDRFGGQAVAQLDTYAGKLDQLANNWDNVQEAIGKALVMNEIAVFAMNRLSEALGQASDKSEDAGVSIAKFWQAAGASDANVTAIAFLEEYLALLNSIDKMSRGIKSPTPVESQPLPNLIGEGLIEWERQNEAIDKARAAAEAARKAIVALRTEISGTKAIGGIKQFAAAWAGLTKSQKESAPAVAALAKFYDALGPNLAEIPPELRAMVAEGEAASRSVGALADEYQSVREEVSKLDLILDRLELAADAEEASQVLQEFGFELQQVERRVGEAFDWSDEIDAAIADIRRIDNEIQEMFEKAEEKGISFGEKLGQRMEEAAGNITGILTEGLIHGANWEDIAAAIGTQIGAGIGGAIGFKLGGPLGELIGEQIGQLLGPLLDSLIQRRHFRRTRSGDRRRREGHVRG